MSEELGTKEEALQFARYWKKEAEQLRAEVERLNIQQLCDVTLSDWAVEHLKVIDELRAELAKVKQEVALDCALMAENDYSAADVAIEIRKKYGLESVHSDRFCLKEVDQ